MANNVKSIPIYNTSGSYSNPFTEGSLTASPVRFYCWTEPTGRFDSLWRDVNVAPICKLDLALPNYFRAAGFPAHTGVVAVTGYPLASSTIQYYCNYAAQNFADYQYAQGFLRGSGAYGNGDYDGAFMIRDFGPISNTAANNFCVLMCNQKDSVSSTSPFSVGIFTTGNARNPYDGSVASSLTGVSFSLTSMFVASGIKECQEVAHIFFKTLKSKLDNYYPSGSVTPIQLCYPAHNHSDVEQIPDQRTWHEATNTKGVKRNIEADARYATEPVVYRINPDLFPAEVLQAHPLSDADEGRQPLTSNQDVRTVANSGISRWYNETWFDIHDYALDRSFYSVGRQYMPYLEHNNYDCVSAKNPNQPYLYAQGFTESNTYYISPDYRNHECLAADASSPVLYPSKAAMTLVYNQGGLTVDQAYVESCKYNIAACTYGTTKPVIPWISYVEGSYPIINGTGIYNHTKENTANAIIACYNLGIREFNMWTDAASESQSDKDKLMWIVNYVNSYINGLVPPISPIPTSPNNQRLGSKSGKNKLIIRRTIA